MTTIRGQTLDDAATLPGRYVRLPPAASSQLADGRPLAANVAMRLHNNLSVLALQGCRHLAWWSGNATLSQKTGWESLLDGAAPDSTEVQGDEADISWSSEVARRFGPFFGIQDRRGAGGEGLLRRVMLEVEVTNAAASLTLYLAITAGRQPMPPHLGYVAFEKKTGPSSSVNTYLLEAATPLRAAEPLECRPGGTARGAATVNAVMYWVWVGWLSTNAGDRVKSISLYEQRD